MLFYGVPETPEIYEEAGNDGCSASPALVPSWISLTPLELLLQGLLVHVLACPLQEDVVARSECAPNPRRPQNL